MPVKMSLSLKGKEEKKGETPGYLFSEAEFFLSKGNSTYGQSLQLLQKKCTSDPATLQPLHQKGDGKKIYRPLTIRESILAKVEDFNREYDKSGIKRDLEDRLKFFDCNANLSSCTGVAYKAATSKFKIIPLCPNLIELASDFNQDFIPIDYNLIDGYHLDWQHDDNYEALWLAALEEDQTLLREYKHIAVPIAQIMDEIDDFYFCLNSGKNTPKKEDILVPISISSPLVLETMVKYPVYFVQLSKKEK